METCRRMHVCINVHTCVCSLSHTYIHTHAFTQTLQFYPPRTHYLVYPRVYNNYLTFTTSVVTRCHLIACSDFFLGNGIRVSFSTFLNLLLIPSNEPFHFLFFSFLSVSLFTGSPYYVCYQSHCFYFLLCILSYLNFNVLPFSPWMKPSISKSHLFSEIQNPA